MVKTWQGGYASAREGCWHRGRLIMKTTARVRVPATRWQDSGLNSQLASHCSLMREELQVAHTNTVSLWASGAKKKKREKFNTELERLIVFIRMGVIFLPHLSPPCMISALCKNSIVNRSCCHSYCSFSAAERHCVKTSYGKRQKANDAAWSLTLFFSTENTALQLEQWPLEKETKKMFKRQNLIDWLLTVILAQTSLWW